VEHRVHEIVADVSVNSGGTVAFMADLNLNEPAVNTILSEMGDSRYLYWILSIRCSVGFVLSAECEARGASWVTAWLVMGVAGCGL
jgi:hypothetical protein